MLSTSTLESAVAALERFPTEMQLVMMAADSLAAVVQSGASGGWNCIANSHSRMLPLRPRTNGLRPRTAGAAKLSERDAIALAPAYPRLLRSHLCGKDAKDRVKCVARAVTEVLRTGGQVRHIASHESHYGLQMHGL